MQLTKIDLIYQLTIYRTNQKNGTKAKETKTTSR